MKLQSWNLKSMIIQSSLSLSLSGTTIALGALSSNSVATTAAGLRCLLGGFHLLTIPRERWSNIRRGSADAVRSRVPTIPSSSLVTSTSGMVDEQSTLVAPLALLSETALELHE